MAKRQRLDAELVEQGFFATKEEALRAVMAGKVSTLDRQLTKAGEQVERGLFLHVKDQKSYVGRGGLKLERALELFEVKPEGKHCLDIGCSTGGFTDCLLQQGAAEVVAVDVGYAQFDWKLRQDARVKLFERTNVVDLPQIEGLPAFDLAVCDVSFTSVTTILPPIVELFAESADFICLVKPQFECVRDEVSDGGLVRDLAARHGAIEKVAACFVELGFGICGLADSPITGHKGNHEYLLHVKRGAQSRELPLEQLQF